MNDHRQFHYIISPILEMRSSPDYCSEVISQALFSERILILEEQKDWLKIQTVMDHYCGWVKKEGICSRETSYVSETFATPIMTKRLSAHLYDYPDTIYGPLLTLPFESRLAAVEFKEDHSRWVLIHLPDSRKAYIQRGDIAPLLPLIDKEEIGKFSLSFLGLPYTWGGRSSFGYDCSGFVQMLYRRMGIFLPRDSQDQFIFQGFSDCPVDALTPGDLIFFGFAKDAIKHVGLALGDGKFIHTSAVTENMPYIRISHIDDFAWNGSGYYPFSFGRKIEKSQVKK